MESNCDSNGVRGGSGGLLWGGGAGGAGGGGGEGQGYFGNPFTSFELRRASVWWGGGGSEERDVRVVRQRVDAPVLE